MEMCAPVSNSCGFLGVPCGILAGSFRDVLACSSRWLGRRWKEWSFLLSTAKTSSFTNVPRMQGKHPRRDSEGRKSARPPQRSRKSSARKPQGNNQETAREPQPTNISAEQKTRHRSHTCPRQVAITGTVHHSTSGLGRHGALRNDNCDKGCFIARNKTKRTRLLCQHILDTCEAFR